MVPSEQLGLPAFDAEMPMESDEYSRPTIPAIPYHALQVATMSQLTEKASK